MQAFLLLPSSPPALNSLTQILPLPLLPILNRPLIEYFILNANKININKIHLISAESDKKLQNHFLQLQEQNDLKNDVVFISGISIPGALKDQVVEIRDTFWLCNTRYFHIFDWSVLLEKHKASKKKISVVVTKFNAVKNLFAAKFDVKTSCLTEILKLEDSSKTKKVNLITELFICEPEVIHYLDIKDIANFCPDLLRVLLKKNNPVNVISAEGIFEPLSNLHYYWALNLNMLKNQQAASWIRGREIAKGIFVGSKIKIKTNLNENIQSPILIGEDCKVSKEVFLRGPAVIGNNVKISPRAIVDRSVVLDNTYIGQSVELQNSIVFQNWYISIKNLFGVYVEEEFILGKNKKFNLKQQVKRGISGALKKFLRKK